MEGSAETAEAAAPTGSGLDVLEAAVDAGSAFSSAAWMLSVLSSTDEVMVSGFAASEAASDEPGAAGAGADTCASACVGAGSNAASDTLGAGSDAASGALDVVPDRGLIFVALTSATSGVATLSLDVRLGALASGVEALGADDVAGADTAPSCIRRLPSVVWTAWTVVAPAGGRGPMFSLSSPNSFHSSTSSKSYNT